MYIPLWTCQRHLYIESTDSLIVVFLSYNIFIYSVHIGLLVDSLCRDCVNMLISIYLVPLLSLYEKRLSEP